MSPQRSDKIIAATMVTYSAIVATAPAWLVLLNEILRRCER